jgi:alpha-L-rhamnosidase
MFLIRPRPGGGLTWATGHYHSIQGRIASEWKIAGAEFQLPVTIPPNTSATVYIPAADVSAVKEGGKPIATAASVKFLRKGDHCVVLTPASTGLSRPSGDLPGVARRNVPRARPGPDSTLPRRRSEA